MIFGSKITAWLGVFIGVAGVLAGAADAVGTQIAQGASVVGTILAGIGGAIIRPTNTRKTD